MRCTYLCLGAKPKNHRYTKKFQTPARWIAVNTNGSIDNPEAKLERFAYPVMSIYALLEHRIEYAMDAAIQYIAYRIWPSISAVGGASDLS